jgi:alpha-glucosidase
MGMANEEPWWKTAVVYQIYVRSFADSTGDGVGDLRGVISRLDYIADLGVDALWMTPFYVSPMADGGYDVANYQAVDHTLGTLDDVDELIAQAHRRDLRVLLDIVPNHTSDQHRWFIEALTSPPGSPARQRYHFHPGTGIDGSQPPNNWQSVFGGPAWSRVASPGNHPSEWYLHLFAPEQPDLNWRNTEVAAEFEDILRFWLTRGVDGFRIDVAHGLIKADGLPNAPEGSLRLLAGAAADRNDPLPFWNQPGVHDIYRGWRSILDTFPGDRMAVAEAWVEKPQQLAAYLRPDELQQAFSFDFTTRPWSAPELRQAIDSAYEMTASVDTRPTWVLANHDIARQVTRYGGGVTGLRRARAAALLMLGLPGSAYLYQGEELGLPEVTDIPEEQLADPIWIRSGGTERGRDGCRVPLPWSTAAGTFGFGPDNSRATWLPQPANWGALSVESELADPQSMLQLYRAALRIRRLWPVSDDRIRWLASPPGTLIFTTSSGRIVAVNAGNDPLDLSPYGSRPVLSTEPVGSTLPADAAVWLDG